MTENELRALLDKPIAYHRPLVPIAGVTGAVMLSQAIYWSKGLKEERDGWFFKKGEEWESETGLTRYEQEGARKKLKAAGVLEEKLVGVPATLWYRINWAGLQSSLGKTHKLVCGKPANWIGENPQTIYTENTTENTLTHTESETEPETRIVPTPQPIGLSKTSQTYKATRKEKTPFRAGGYASQAKPAPKPVRQHAVISSEFKEFITLVNDTRKSGHRATSAGQELWDFWLAEGYLASEISMACEIAYKTDDWWKAHFTPELFLRTTSESGVALNNIDKFLNGKADGNEAILLIKQSWQEEILRERGGVQ